MGRLPIPVYPSHIHINYKRPSNVSGRSFLDRRMYYLGDKPCVDATGAFKWAVWIYRDYWIRKY